MREEVGTRADRYLGSWERNRDLYYMRMENAVELVIQSNFQLTRFTTSVHVISSNFYHWYKMYGGDGICVTLYPSNRENAII